MRLLLILILLIVLFTMLRIIDKSVKQLDSINIMVDSLQEEVSYLKGLEEICFPVAMEMK